MKECSRILAKHRPERPAQGFPREIIVKSKRAELKAVRFVPKTQLGPKYLVVVYREESGQKRTITAYFASDPKKLKGEVVLRA